MDIIEQQIDLKSAAALYPETIFLKKKSRKQAFMSEFAASRRRLYGYILTYVPNQADAADILQETAMLAWEKFDTFVPGSDFTAWAVAMARYKILKLRSARFDRRVKFDSTLIEGFDVVADASLDDIDLRSEIVQGCIRKLADRDANLIRLRYEKGMKTVEIAEMNNRPLQGLYKTMARIHRNLRECISRGLKQEAAQ